MVSGGFEIKVANKKELQELFEIKDQFLEKVPKNATILEKTIRRGVVPPNPASVGKDSRVLIARVNGKIVGFAHFGPHKPGIGKLHEISVIEEKRRMKIANMLLQVTLRKMLRIYPHVIFREAIGSEKFYKQMEREVRIGKAVLGSRDVFRTQAFKKTKRR